MYCPECGEKNPDDARFCGGCGVTLQAPENGNLPPNRPVGQDSVSDGMKYGILGASVLLPVIGLIMGLIYLYTDGSESRKSAGKLWLIGSIVMMVVYAIIGAADY